MKIIAGNLKADNIQIHCEACSCVYELESRDDFDIHWVAKPMPGGWCDFHVEIPEYRIICPVCKYDIYIGIDREDYDREAWFYNNRFNELITSRPDWKSRYKSEPRKER